MIPASVSTAGLVVPLVSDLPPSDFMVTFTRPGFVPEAFKRGLTQDQSRLLDILFATPSLRVGEIVDSAERPRRSVARDLARLLEVGRARSEGQTVNARWEPVREP